MTGEVYSGIPGAVTIQAVAWPNQAALDALPDDAEVPMFILEDVTVDGNSYTVRIDPDTLPADYVSETGVDLEITAHHVSGDTDTYSETVSIEDGVWLRSSAATDLLGAHDIQTPDIPGFLVVGDDLDDGGTEVNPLATWDMYVADPIGPICKTSKTSNTHDHRAKISDVMANTPYVKGKATYKIGSNHELGVAWKSTGGSVEAGGTVSRKSSESVSPDAVNTDHTAWTDWRYRDFKNTCRGTQARPGSHQGGYYRTSRSRPSYTHCKHYPAATWTRTTNKAWTYRAGVTIWGVNVHTQVGYDDETALVYVLEKGKYLCGNNANPPKAKLVAAGRS
jgi:hypothetical protein